MRVTALVVTYNHLPFISQAVESALHQQTRFPYEILVSEDCSTDGTRELVLDYQRRYPDHIRLILSDQNLHSNAVVARGIRAARGEFVTILDGDDLWTSPHKLQKQVDFLEANPGCALCFHNAKVVHEDGDRPPGCGLPLVKNAFQRSKTSGEATSSPRPRQCSEPRPSRTSHPGVTSLFPITDWPLYILAAEHGTIGYIDEVMSVYRYHAGGLYSARNKKQKLQSTAHFYRIMDANTGRRYHDLIRAASSIYFFEWAEEYVRRRDLGRARACMWRSLLGGGVGDGVSWRAFTRLAARVALEPWRRNPNSRAAAN